MGGLEPRRHAIEQDGIRAGTELRIRKSTDLAPAQPAGLLTLQLFDTTGRAIPSRFDKPTQASEQPIPDMHCAIDSVRFLFPQGRTLEFKLKTEMPSRDGS